ncbi:MAG TPA: hypothetical protein VNU70_04225 [Puia sp.]|jgi:hypothetical protein|nr:hypothetical protein [Puia sp.]
MADINPSSEQKDFLEEPQKLPSTLNVLTILTFIGCGLALIGSLWIFFKAQDSYDMTVANQDKMEKMPDWVRNMQGPDPVGTARKVLDNKVPILLLGLVATALCLYGAIQMRKLKKTGFGIYTIGEILPLLSGYLFIGESTLSGMRGVFSILFVALFVILYATQLKYMKK